MTRSEIEQATDFHLSPNLIESIEKEFGFILSTQDISLLETYARETIQRRRYMKGRKERQVIREEYAAMMRRRDAILRTVKELKELLDADEQAPLVWRLNVGLNALDRSASVRDDVTPTMKYISWLAAEDHPFKDAVTGLREQRRRKTTDRDGWDHLILTTILIFHWHGKPFTANYITKKRGYDLPLLRGLALIHDALPHDVRAKSSAALGSPAHEWIRKANSRKKDGETFVHRGEWQVR